MTQQQHDLSKLCEQSFRQILDGIAQVEAKLDGLVGGLDKIEQLVRTAEQDKSRAAELKKLHISAADIALGAKLNAGGFGEIFFGKYQRKNVAVKKLEHSDNTELTAKELEDAENEVLMMHHVACANVLLVYGLAVDPARVLIVLEMAPFGSLWDVLAGSGGALSKEMPVSLLVAWMVDLCYGVAHLHSKRVKHKDIKAQNLLLYQTPNRLGVKICDFGLAKQSSAAGLSSASSAGGGTFAFMAPECRNGLKSSAKSDVFSIGMTMLQILTRANPGVTQWEEQCTRASLWSRTGSLALLPPQAQAQAQTLPRRRPWCWQC